MKKWMVFCVVLLTVFAAAGAENKAEAAPKDISAPEAETPKKEALPGAEVVIVEGIMFIDDCSVCPCVKNGSCRCARKLKCQCCRKNLKRCSDSMQPKCTRSVAEKRKTHLRPGTGRKGDELMMPNFKGGMMPKEISNPVSPEKQKSGEACPMM